MARRPFIVIATHIFAGAIAAAIVTLGLAAAASAQTAPAVGALAGTVTALSSPATLTRAAVTMPMTSGMAVNVGDRIITGATGRVTITLNDRSTLQIGESSNLTIDAEMAAHAGVGATTRVSLLGGIVRSLVNFSGARPNFSVHTPNAVAAARGTRFDTSFSQGTARPGYAGCREYTDVAVYEGVVAVSNPTNPSAPTVTVTPGYQVTVPCSLSSTEPGPIGVGGAGASIVPGGGAPPPSCPVCVNMP